MKNIERVLLQKTLAIFYPGCIEFEIMLACEILNKDFPVEVATPGGEDHIGSNGMTIKANTSFELIDPAKYKTILVPGGDPGYVIGNQRLSEVLQQAYTNRSILGAICAGPIIFEQAGLLKNRRIAHGYKGAQLKWITEKGFFKETILSDDPYIVDDNIVTARPDSFIDFAVEIGVQAGTISPNRISFFKSYYRGNNSENENLKT